MLKICDSHNDFLVEIKNIDEKQKYFSYLNKNKKIKNICCIVWTSELKRPLEFLLEIYNKYFKKNINKKFILCIEDLGFINENNFSEAINIIVKLKPFACGIVWNNDNSLCGGADGKKSLTKLGEKVVKILENNNILIDTAHMNQKTFWKFCKITTKPIYNSHCNFSHFKEHNRNINSKQIKYIINSKGFIGFSFVQYFMSNYSVDSKIVAKQLKYFINKYGNSCIGIGTDFYGTKNLPIDLNNYEQFTILKKALKKEGLNTKTIDKILFKNFMNFKKNIININ